MLQTCMWIYIKQKLNNNMPASCINLPGEFSDILNSKSYVVTLDRNKYRYDITSKLLRDAGFTDVVPFQAVDGLAAVDATDEYDARWKSMATAFHWDLDKCHLSPGQAGVFMSMIQVWSWIACSPGPGAMVFEDDALPRPDFGDVFPAYWDSLGYEGHIDVVYIGAQHHPNHIKNHMSSNGYFTRRPTHCLHAHYMTRVGARKILDFLPTLFDWWAAAYEPGNHIPNGEADGFQHTITDGGIYRDFNEAELFEYNYLIPNLSCVAFYGPKIPVKGEFQYETWPERDTGLIHQNASLGSNIGEFETTWLDSVQNKVIR